MPAYIPPALRGKADPNLSNKSSTASSDDPPDSTKQTFTADVRKGNPYPHDTVTSRALYLLREIHHHFWPSEKKRFAEDTSVQKPDDVTHGGHDESVSINATAPADIDSGVVDHTTAATPASILESEKFQPNDSKPKSTESPKAAHTSLPSKFEQSSTYLHKGSTLNATESNPNTLGYVILFTGANPRWDSDGIIFAKTGLELLEPLPQSTEGKDNEQADTMPAQSDSPAHLTAGPVPVFAQHRGVNKATRNFRFLGRYHVSQVDILEPQSEDLVRMLKQKWSVTDRRGYARAKERDEEAWRRSLGTRWAVIKFERAEGVEGEQGIDIEREDDGESADHGGRGSGRKGVNELLKEMRMNN
ncbi:MAG: hypothetical protein Q9227_004887 [Pyrenula ochraceoflavens]